MLNQFKIASIVVLALLGAGCLSTLSESLESRQAYVNSHDVSEEVRLAILEGRVIEGMTMDDVYATWGFPSDRDTSETLGLHGQYGKEVWIYESAFTDDFEAEVFFRNRVVHSVSPIYLSSFPQD